MTQCCAHAHTQDRKLIFTCIPSPHTFLPHSRLNSTMFPSAPHSTPILFNVIGCTFILWTLSSSPASPSTPPLYGNTAGHPLSLLAPFLIITPFQCSNSKCLWMFFQSLYSKCLLICHRFLFSFSSFCPYLKNGYSSVECWGICHHFFSFLHLYFLSLLPCQT